MTKTQNGLFSILALSVLGVAFFLTMAWISPPAPLSADAPQTEFSAGRAMRDLEIIAQEPHPVGASLAHARVRDYLLGEIRALDLEPQVQDTFAYFVRPGALVGAFVENIVVRLPGTNPEGAILLMSHYDSSPGAPGAVDSGSGVVTILELLRALHASPPLRQDVIILFSDGEEPGTLGAHAFVSQHPWLADVRLAINMDQFWVGPPVLVRSSQGNGMLVQAMARSGLPKPAHLSFPFDLFPSGDTDLSPFISAGVPGAEFNGGGPFTEKHTALDRPGLIDPGSLQQAGNQIRALVREMGNQPSLEIHAPDQTFFPVMGFLVHYPNNLAWPLAILGALCYLVAIYYGFRKKHLTWRGLGMGFLVFFLGLAMSVVLANLLWRGIQVIHPEYAYDSTSLFRQKLSSDYLYAIGLIVLAAAIMVFLVNMARKKVSIFDLTGGASFTWLPLTLATTILMPATSYLFAWVLLGSSLAHLMSMRIQSRKHAFTLSGLGFLGNAILGIFLWIPLFYYAILAGPLSPDSPMLSMLIGLAGLWLGSLIPILDWIASVKRWLLPATAFFISLGFIVAGHFLVGKASPPPLANSIGYWLDANNNSTCWITFSDEFDERQRNILIDPTSRPYTDLLQAAPSFSVLTSVAPTLALQSPRLEVLTDEWVGGSRVLQARVISSMLERTFIIVPKEAALQVITLPKNNRINLPLDNVTDWWLRFEGVPAEGFEITLEFSKTGPFQLLLVDERTGLPNFPGISTQPVPGTMKSPGVFTQVIPTDFTVIKRSWYISALIP